MASRYESTRRKLLEMSVQQLPVCYRRDMRVLFYALEERSYGIHGAKVVLERALAVVNKAIAALNILEA